MAASLDNSEHSDDINISTLPTMYGSHSPWRAPEFPLVYPTKDHTVLYQIHTQGLGTPPQPLAGHDKWDYNHVKMPTSDKSMYDVTKVMLSSVNRWKNIENALKKPIKNSNDLANTILGYNTKFANTWKFASMHKFFNQYWNQIESKDFFENVLPKIASLALDLQKLVQAPIPLLKKEMNKSISMSQQQIASLLANAFFCTFPRRNTTAHGSEYASYPRINFTTLYESDADGIMEKLKCICHYFRRVSSAMPTGVVTFSRRHVQPFFCPDWERSQVPIVSTPLHVDHDVYIEDATGLIQVMFSNQFLGGGVLGNNLLQQEIRFLICPELMVSMLFTEILEPNDALMIIGCERYSKYTGNDRASFRWAGDFRDETPLDGSGRRRCAVLAIDAGNFNGNRKQYHIDSILRELNKVYIGVSFFIDPSVLGVQYPGVATGNWGCGGFNGDPQLKALIQLMACAQAQRPIAYFTFKDTRQKKEVAKIYNVLKQNNVTVGRLFNLIISYHKTNLHSNLHTHVKFQLEKNMPPAYTPCDPLGAQQNTFNLYHLGYHANFFTPNHPVHTPSYAFPNTGRHYNRLSYASVTKSEIQPAESPSNVGTHDPHSVGTRPIAKKGSKAKSATAETQQPSTAKKDQPPTTPSASDNQQMPKDPPASDSSSAIARARILEVQAQYARKMAEIEKAAVEAEMRAALAAINAEEGDDDDTPVA